MMDKVEIGILACGLVLLMIVSAVISIAARLDGREDGYRRGYCEGRGGVQARVDGHIRCIRPPVEIALDTARSR